MPERSSRKDLKAADAQKKLKALANPDKVKILSSFFKTGPGQYGHGDVFLGVTVPQTRSVAKLFASLPVDETLILLHSAVHEERLLALLIWVDQSRKADQSEKETIYRLYLKNTKYINNWDLVDLSARPIVGEYLADKDRSILKKLAVSPLVWDRRIAIIATFAFINRDDFADTFHIAEILLKDQHDLIHKAVGWMLREVGKRDRAVAEDFLKRHYTSMPRTMLRYAIEYFTENRRQLYLKGLV